MEDLLEELSRLMDSGLLDDSEVRFLRVAEPPPLPMPTALDAALAAPRGAARLRDIACGASSAVIITSDATRALPNHALLPSVVGELTAGGIHETAVEIVVGTGAHKPLEKTELSGLLGEWSQRLRVSSHDSRASDLVRAGTTASGNDVLINRRVMQADIRVALGRVEPHEFAGFTGGPKAILPAVAGYATIMRNHSVANLQHPCSRPGVLAGNPIHAEFIEAARLARLDFAVNVVLDRDLRPVALAAGDPVEAQAELVSTIRSYGQLALPRDVDLPDLAPDLIVSGPERPLDVNLYQAIKALVAIESLVDDKSTVVLIAACHEGTGSQEMLEPFAEAESAANVISQLDRDYTVEKDHSYLLARFLSRCPTVFACCPGVKEHDLLTLGLRPGEDVLETTRSALQCVKGRRAHPYVLLFPGPQRSLIAGSLAPTGATPPNGHNA